MQKIPAPADTGTGTASDKTAKNRGGEKVPGSKDTVIDDRKEAALKWKQAMQVLLNAQSEAYFAMIGLLEAYGLLGD